jgi:hypothetical protein
MNSYIIEDATNCHLLVARPIVYANKPIDAVKKHLQITNRENLKIKVSGELNVHFGAIPCIIENGQTFILGGKRQTWFKII